MPPKKTVEASGDSIEPSQDSASPQPAPKRARNAQSRVKGKKGALERVLDLPVDLIWEICSHLDVQGLLALSNTNKSFRTVVTGESSKTFFKRARERIGMPELLLPMSDLRYATLIYGKGCNICGKSNAGKVDPSFRARICSACLKKDFIDPQADESKEKMEEFNEFAKYCATYTTAKSGHDSSCYLVDLRRISKELDAKFPITSREVKAAQHRWQKGGVVEYVSGIETSIATGNALAAHSFFARSLLTGLNTPWTPQGRFQIWYHEHQKERKLREKDTEALKHWLKEAETKKSQVNQQLRSGRREDIERRLGALGFDKAEFQSEAFKEHPQVKASRPLSDRVFTSTVEPALRQVLEDNRRDRIKWILEDQYNQSVKNHAEGAYFPPASTYLDLAVLQPVLRDASQYPRKPLILPPQTKSAASKEIFDLIRKRREKLLRSIAEARFDLAQEFEKKKKTNRQAKEDEEMELEEEEKFSPTEFTSLRQVPLTLPRLPPWIPRDSDQDILASDEQIVSFLDNSPLARFECIECRTLYNTRDLLAHQSYGRGCTRKWPLCSSTQRTKDWVIIEGIDDVAKPRIRINKDVLSLSLKLQQFIETTPLVVVEESKKLPSLGAEYSMGQEEDNWYRVGLCCDCKVEPLRISYDPVPDFYAHVVKRKLSCRIKSSVCYSREQISRWRTLREAKHVDTGEYVEAERQDEQNEANEEEEDYIFV
ncbi:hypothetical protein JCM3765_004505 [Sporobolomyces pararoseus]